MRSLGVTSTEQGSVAGEVSLAFRVMLAGSVVMMALTLSLFGWLRLVNEPRAVKLDRLTTAVQDSHAGLVDQETGLRGYLATGEHIFLQPYDDGRAAVAAADAALAANTTSARLDSDVLSFRVAQQRWVDQWASLAAQGAATAQILDPQGRIDPERTAGFLNAGKDLMDSYRVTEQKLIHDARAAAMDQRLQERHVTLGFCLALLAVAAAEVASALARRRRLRARVGRPIAAMLETVQAVAAGDLRPPAEVTGSADLERLRDGLAAMTKALSEQQVATDLRERATARSTLRLQQVLLFAREVSGSSSLRYVLEAFTTAGSALTDAQAVRVWVGGEEPDRLTLASDSRTGRKRPPPTETAVLGIGTVGRAAQYGRLCRSDDLDAGAQEAERGEVIAVPLIVGARVTGVLELIGASQVDVTEALSLLETIAGHAATAMDAARLYEQAQTLSVTDALTGLANRRRLDEDLKLEVERAVRYGRPLALIMVDLDHFKALNDSYGHPRGDAVLQQVATILSSTVRTCDTVYRYGGEELAVVVRDTDLASAWTLAERLREAVQTWFARVDGPAVTLSAGVAAVPEHAASPTALLKAADKALYVAKNEGRNRSALATA